MAFTAIFRINGALEKVAIIAKNSMIANEKARAMQGVFFGSSRRLLSVYRGYNG